MFAVLLLSLLGCEGERSDDEDITPVIDAPHGPLGLGRMQPFPHSGLMKDGKLDLKASDFSGDMATPLPVERLNFRTGFSVAQTSVLSLDGIRDVNLPSLYDPKLGTGSVRCFDLQTDAVLPCMAELDAHPDADIRSLLVRPLTAWPLSRIGIAVSSDVVDRPPEMTEMMAGDSPDGAKAKQLLATFARLGMQDVSVGWDFFVADGTSVLRSALAKSEDHGTYTLEQVRTPETPFTYKAAEGVFEVTNFLVDDRLLDNRQGELFSTGTTEAALYVHIPESVKDAPAGSVPVLIFGHGILSNPGDYLDSSDDVHRVMELADRLGFVVVGTVWRGLTTSDLDGAVLVAQDLGRFPELTGRMVQAQVNVDQLIRVIQGGLFEDEQLRGVSGQVLADPGKIRYHGISLGGIMGGVMMGLEADVDAAVLHVGGSMWSTMLERSSNWTSFALFVEAIMPDPVERQQMYALTQLWWDPVDPISYADGLSRKKVLLQVSIGDEQVPNFTSHALARSVGWPHLSPVSRPLYGLEQVTAPRVVGGDLANGVVVELDAQLGLPFEGNRPGEESLAHDEPRHWDGTLQQAIHFLQTPTLGEVVHPCGDAPCARDNQGSF